MNFYECCDLTKKLYLIYYLKSTLGDDQMDIVILHLDLDHSDDDDEEF